MAASYRDYDPATLVKLQNVLRGMLRDFDALCRKHGLRYFAGGGTAIGALRHGGMIPWDDDIDLNFLREDYERFLDVAEKEYGDKYYVVNARKYPGYPLMTTRWCLRGTVFREECFRNLDVPLGIFLDIYFFDPIPNDEALARRQWRRAWFWGKLMTLRQVPNPVLFGGGVKRALLAAACRVGHVALRALFRQDFLVRKAEGWSRKFEGRSDFARAAWMFDTALYLSVIEAGRAVQARRVPFDDGEVNLAGNCEDYLRAHYGDFMRVPPPEKRHNHPPLELDFGPYA